MSAKIKSPFFAIKERLKCNTMLKIKKALKGKVKNGKWEEILGYTCKKLKKHLENNLPKGYIWQDYLEGKLCFDHIIPNKAFLYKTAKDKEFRECFSLYNLRLITIKENVKKQDNIHPILLKLLIS